LLITFLGDELSTRHQQLVLARYERRMHMPARVFISCGQREGERQIAQAVADWFVVHGFRPYVALEAQSVQDINSGIIRELRRSDYYVFIDFKRERLTGSDTHRGSLFSHQELAIAYATEFEYALFFREAGVDLEGFAAFMASNATVFDDRAALPALVSVAVQRRGWSPNYSRNLVVGQLRLTDELLAYRNLRGRFLYCDIHNRRVDVGATSVVARLASLSIAGGPVQVSPNRSHLKVTGQHMAFEQTIWPSSHGAFDLLCIDANHGSRVYLNNALDLLPTPSLFDSIGEHLLVFEVWGHGFERISFTVRLRTTVICAEASASLVDGHDAV
jgi:hypothetical protein